MPPTLQAKLLGEFCLVCDDRPVTSSITRRSQALLAYLMLHRHAPQTRHRVAFHLWADSTDTQARTNLRKELSGLRRVLPNVDQFLLIDAKTLQWHPSVPFTLDVVQFEESMRAAQIPIGTGHSKDATQKALEYAIALYQGTLLPDCHDDWIEPERERLQQMRVKALEQLIDLLEEQQEYRPALDYAQQLLRIDTLNEATYCALMRLHHLSGDRANALQIYHRCMTVLREELGVDPSATTRKLYEQILEDNEAPIVQTTARIRSLPLSSSPSRLLPLVGREHEWASIQQWVSLSDRQNTTDAADQASEVLLLTGEPGIGKTRLLEELRATQADQVLWGRGFLAEMVRPYGIWIDALRSLTVPPAVNLPTALGFLLPEMGQPTQAPPDRSHLFDAVVQLLSQSAHPLIVILDDIQWMDEASSALLHYAIRLLSHLPVLFACTGRSRELEANGAISRVMQALRRERRLRTLDLQPFDREHTAELIRSVLIGSGQIDNGQIDSGQISGQTNPVDLSAAVVDRVFIDSGGNPLFALEVARALSHNQSTQATDLTALIGDRLRQLDAAALECLFWASALGRSFQPTRVAQVADYPLPKLLMAIEQLEQQSLIRPNTSTGHEMAYDFAHDIVRQVVYHQLSEPRRHLIHLQIAHKLNQLSTSDYALAGDVAHHASLGGDHELAASAALLAADRCLKLFAYAEASTLAQQGVQHCQRLDDRTRIHLQLGLLRIYAIAGVTCERAVQLETDVHRLMSEASRLGLKDDEAIGLEALGILYFNQGNFVDIDQYSLRATKIAQATSPAITARLLAFNGSCLAELGRDMIRAEALLLEAQSLAARVGMKLCDIDGGLGSICLHNGRYDEARALLQQAWQQAQAEQDHWRECNCLSYLVMTELEANDLIATLSYCHEMAIIAAKIRGESSEGIVTTALTALANYRLQQPDAEIVLEQAITSLKQVDAKRMLAYVLIGAAEVDLECERFKVAAIRAEAALQAAQITNHPSEIALAWAILIQSTLALGERDRATAQFEAPHRPTNRFALSTRAQTAVDRVIMQYRRLSPLHSKNLQTND